MCRPSSELRAIFAFGSTAVQCEIADSFFVLVFVCSCCGFAMCRVSSIVKWFIGRARASLVSRLLSFSLPQFGVFSVLFKFSESKESIHAAD